MADLATLIAALLHPERAARASSAAELYQYGRELADAALARWLADPEFAALVTGQPTVGVAVRPQTFEDIHAANNSPRLAEVPPDQDAREFELHFAAAEIDRRVAPPQLDILTTNQPGGDGAIARYLAKFGEGIQQVEYEVKDVERATEILRARFGLPPIYPQTRAGADGTRVNFFLAPAPDGKKVLIELVESRKTL